LLLTDVSDSTTFILLCVEVAIEILIDLVSDWLFNVLNDMEGKFMAIIISSGFKFMCLVAAVGSFGSVYAGLARHYRRAL